MIWLRLVVWSRKAAILPASWYSSPSHLVKVYLVWVFGPNSDPLDKRLFWPAVIGPPLLVGLQHALCLSVASSTVVLLLVLLHKNMTKKLQMCHACFTDWKRRCCRQLQEGTCYGPVASLNCESSLLASPGEADFPFVNGRWHFSKRSLPFETVDAIS